MSLIGGCMLAAVAVQLAATLLFQFRPFARRAYRLDFVGLLPRWRFFIPDGGSHDLAIAVRGCGVDGTPGDWRTVWEMPIRTRWSWLWSPDRADDQALWFAVATLDARVAAGRAASAATSHAYALIRDRLARLTDDAGLADGHFALVRIAPTGERRIGYVAAFDTAEVAR